jgi:hypothetical protein
MTPIHGMPASPSSFSGTWPRRTAPAELALAVRTVDRWGLVAGVTGTLGNVLLAILFLTPADGPYEWTGPANDTIGIVATLSMIPVAAGLLAVCGNSPGLGAVTSLAILAMVMIAAVSLLFVLGRAPFSADVDSSYVGLVFIFGWLLAVGRAGRASGRLPRQVAGWGVALGAAGLAGAVLLTASALTPAGAALQHVAFAAGALAAGPAFAAYPVWLVVLSYRLPNHLAGLASTGDSQAAVTAG